MLILKSATSDKSVDSATITEVTVSYLGKKTEVNLPLLSLRVVGFSAQTLAYMLDSLVRVSRRVNENHFVRISNAAAEYISTSGNSQAPHNFVVQALKSNQGRETR
jgi:hypothetical protein